MDGLLRGLMFILVIPIGVGVGIVIRGVGVITIAGIRGC
jgi:hypothetical protein